MMLIYKYDIQKVLACFILIFVFFSSSCNKSSSIENNEKECNSQVDSIVLNNVQNTSLNDKKNKIENIRSETNQISPVGRKKYVYSGDPMLDNLTRAAQVAAYCDMSPSNEHVYEYTNEFLKNGYLADKKCIFCDAKGLSMELSQVDLQLFFVDLNNLDEDKINKLISKCKFPNLTRKLVYNVLIPKLKKERKEKEKTLVDY